MKLELKHLAPYLPYDLDYWSIDDECVNTLMKISHNGYGNLLINNEHHEDRIKPYLYPLSDLTKEMDIDGVKISAVDELYPNGVDVDGFELDILNNSIQTMDYFKLLEWHFDVFGLISNGLAIDINTL